MTERISTVSDLHLEIPNVQHPQELSWFRREIFDASTKTCSFCGTKLHFKSVFGANRFALKFLHHIRYAKEFNRTSYRESKSNPVLWVVACVGCACSKKLQDWLETHALYTEDGLYCDEQYPKRTPPC